ncbi:hypothetical protein Rvan_3175 [Rhodomicrobium vannielii ATCC 17100]|uniref:Uncharacterized protein n=1 Tax=Rhodomicrobium vannielii (strain ATCC 17100 / DSM 162 / LMG 4299 / NCIMB 10020 / ATH 3.1.1) TaxID=648757 RepID=E3I1J6_RHOVT|nr:hypothetical protein [Rhodomicrobium vannielii]ADP72371.1 hypothetical protein Rvan_3175 [Rhodomicrobium vannielii ATCC 17100]
MFDKHAAIQQLAKPAAIVHGWQAAFSQCDCIDAVLSPYPENQASWLETIGATEAQMKHANHVGYGVPPWVLCLREVMRVIEINAGVSATRSSRRVMTISVVMPLLSAEEFYGLFTASELSPDREEQARHSHSRTRMHYVAREKILCRDGRLRTLAPIERKFACRNKADFRKEH